MIEIQNLPICSTCGQPIQPRATIDQRNNYQCHDIDWSINFTVPLCPLCNSPMLVIPHSGSVFLTCSSAHCPSYSIQTRRGYYEIYSSLIWANDKQEFNELVITKAIYLDPALFIVAYNRHSRSRLHSSDVPLFSKTSYLSIILYHCHNHYTVNQDPVKQFFLSVLTCNLDQLSKARS